MSSYLLIYAVDKEKKEHVEIFNCSRNSNIYQEVSESWGSIFYIGNPDVDCKEWYACRSNDEKSKYVKTKEEAIEPIPENEEYNEWLKTREGPCPECVYHRYFIEEEYNSLPTHYELVVNKYTNLKERLPEIICSINNEIIKDEERYKYYDQLAKVNIDNVDDALEWKEFLQEKKDTLDFFKHLNMLDCDLYCCID